MKSVEDPLTLRSADRGKSPSSPISPELVPEAPKPTFDFPQHEARKLQPSSLRLPPDLPPLSPSSPAGNLISLAETRGRVSSKLSSDAVCLKQNSPAKMIKRPAGKNVRRSRSERLVVLILTVVMSLIFLYLIAAFSRLLRGKFEEKARLCARCRKRYNRDCDWSRTGCVCSNSTESIMDGKFCYSRERCVKAFDSMLRISKHYMCPKVGTSLSILLGVLINDTNQWEMAPEIQKIRLIQFITSEQVDSRKGIAKRRALRSATLPPFRDRTTKSLVETIDSLEEHMAFMKRLKKSGFYNDRVTKKDGNWSLKTAFLGANLLIRAAHKSSIWKDLCDAITRAARDLGWKMKRKFLLHFTTEEEKAMDECDRDLQELLDKMAEEIPKEADFPGKCHRISEVSPHMNTQRPIVLDGRVIQIPVWVLDTFATTILAPIRERMAFHIAFFLVNKIHKQCSGDQRDGAVLQCQFQKLYGYCEKLNLCVVREQYSTSVWLHTNMEISHECLMVSDATYPSECMPVSRDGI